MKINFYFNDTVIRIPKRTRLKKHLTTIFEKEGKPLKSLTYIFCTDKYLLTINKKFLRHDDYTDIITFCLSDLNDPVVGEIYISADRIRDNAKGLGISTNTELHRVIFHGALHLCGFKDKRKKDKEKMTQEEDKNLKIYFN